jgi:hypothetical protein
MSVANAKLILDRKGNQMNEKQLKSLMAQIVRDNAKKLEAEKKEAK